MSVVHPCCLCGKHLIEDKDHFTSFFKNDAFVEAMCEDCINVSRRAKYRETGVISSKLMIDAVVAPKTAAPILLKVRASYDTLRAVLKAEYEPIVWFGGLQEKVRASNAHSHSAKNDAVELLVFASAGRVMQTMNLPSGRSFTIMSDETSEESRSGVHGIDATEDEALAAMRAVVAGWKDGTLVLAVDADVHL